MSTRHRSFSVLTALPLAGALLAMTATPRAQVMQIPFQKFVLDNGLEVVIHEDHSDPVVAVYINYHVGSAREELGRSGFAHLFEHLMFQGSAHVADDGHFKLVSGAGGTLNGTTNRDRTNYFETLPSNQLETALWLEADRMGWLLGAITQEKLDNQREVVKNERRQNYENVPYAQAGKDVMAALYPHGHPYSWLTIGSHEDLSARRSTTCAASSAAGTARTTPRSPSAATSTWRARSRSPRSTSAASRADRTWPSPRRGRRGSRRACASSPRTRCSSPSCP